MSKRRITVVSTQNNVFLYYSFIFVLFICYLSYYYFNSVSLFNLSFIIYPLDNDGW